MDHRFVPQLHLVLLDESLQSVDETEVVVDEFQVEGGESFAEVFLVVFGCSVRGEGGGDRPSTLLCALYEVS